MKREDLPERWAIKLNNYIENSPYKKWNSLVVCDFEYDIIIKFEDHSRIEFNDVLVWEDEEEYMVFTEHCGYHIFNKNSVVKIKYKPYWVNKEACK